jgi:hypothetical protein
MDRVAKLADEIKRTIARYKRRRAQNRKEV